MSPGDAAPSVRPETPSWRFVATLALAGAVAGGLLVFVYQATQPAILAHKAEMLKAAIGEVLGAPARSTTLYVRGADLSAEPPPGADPKTLEPVYLGFDAAGKPVGFAIVAGANGYADEIRLIVGYDPTTKKIRGLKVLESKETPGLGDSIEKDPHFAAQFEGKEFPIHGVKQGESNGDTHAVDMITGATISSRAVVGIVRGALERLDPVLSSWLAAHPGGGPDPASPSGPTAPGPGKEVPR